MKDKTVAQELYSLVKAEFAKGRTKISKSEIIAWGVVYVENGIMKTANNDTKPRKLRKLIEANYLGVIIEGGQAYIVPPKGSPRTTEDPPQQFRYEPVLDDSGRAIAMKEIPV